MCLHMPAVLLPRRHQRPIALHASTAHSWRAAPWQFAYEVYCAICLRQHHARLRLVRNLQRRRAPCLVAVIHQDTRLTLHHIFDNATFGSAHSPTAQENRPRLIAAIRLKGPLPSQSTRQLSSTRPLVDDDHADG